MNMEAMDQDNEIISRCGTPEITRILRSKSNEDNEVEAFSVARFPVVKLPDIIKLIKSEKSIQKVEKGPNVSFMTTKDRELFPIKMPQNRFGNEICPLRGAPHRGPGAYENEDKTNFWYGIEHKINSVKGYTMGARTGPRFPKENTELLLNLRSKSDIMASDKSLEIYQRQNTWYKYQTPSPTAYQTHCTDLTEFQESEKPFLVGSDRFPVSRKDVNEVLPGPGTYEHEIKRNRKVQLHQSFGGTPIMLPMIQVRSTIDKNTEKLYSTKEEKKYNRKLAYLKLYYE